MKPSRGKALPEGGCDILRKSTPRKAIAPINEGEKRERERVQGRNKDNDKSFENFYCRVNNNFLAKKK